MLHVYFDGVREGPVGVGKTNVEELVVYSVRGGEGETTVESVEGYVGEGIRTRSMFGRQIHG